jgi:hypothetical protein
LVKGFTDEVAVPLAGSLELLEQFLVYRAGELLEAVTLHVFGVVPTQRADARGTLGIEASGEPSDIASAIVLFGFGGLGFGGDHGVVWCWGERGI